MNTQKHGVRFAGYAALFDKQDRGGDIIRRGAYARAIAWWRGRRTQECTRRQRPPATQPARKPPRC